jgi:DNA-binding PadR family transcriptional regulator
MVDQNSGGRWREHPHWHAGEKRFRAGRRFGAGSGFPGDRGFDPEPDEAELGGPGFGRMGFHGGPGPRGTGRPHGMPGPHGGPGEFGPWGKGYRRRGGGRAKRGDVRAAALALLAEEPMNGYQIIQQISERSGGLWQPSPGSVYPALAQLEDENLIALQDVAGARRAYGLTEGGRGYVTAHAAELEAPWSAMAGAASAAHDMRKLVQQVHLAAFQVISAGTDDQVNQARKVLTQARRALYRILAEDEPDSDGPAEGEHGGTEPAS